MSDIVLKSFPFDSMKVLNETSNELEDDRLYEAQIFRDYFRKFLSNGVYYGNYKNYGENSMQVVLDTGLTIKVKKGCGIIEGVDYENETDRLITLDRPASGSRVDRIVVQMNSSLDARKTKLIVKQGSGTTPAELTRTDNVYEICIAEVTVSSTSNLTDESIVDKRLDTTLCGIVSMMLNNQNSIVLTGKININTSGGELVFDYPSGFNNENCVVISTGIAIYPNNDYYWFGSLQSATISTNFTVDGIKVRVTHLNNAVITGNNLNVKVVLMKIS